MKLNNKGSNEFVYKWRSFVQQTLKLTCLQGLTCYIRQHNEHKLMSVSRAVLPASLNFVFRKLCTGIFFLKLIQNINNVSKYMQIYGGVVGPDKKNK